MSPAGLPQGLDWDPTHPTQGATNGTRWVYNPVNECPRAQYSVDQAPTPTLTLTLSLTLTLITQGKVNPAEMVRGKLDAGPYLVVHPVPTDPGATGGMHAPDALGVLACSPKHV